MKWGLKSRISALLAVGLAVGWGCGYKLGPPVAAPGGVRTVAVPAFLNRTNELGVERAFTSAARAELLRRRVVKIVPHGGEAELIGEVTSFRAVPAAPVGIPGGGAKLIPRRYHAFASVRIQLVARRTGEVLWEDHLSANADFPAGGAEGFEGVTQKTNQDAVLISIADRIMREATARLFADF